MTSCGPIVNLRRGFLLNFHKTLDGITRDASIEPHHGFFFSRIISKSETQLIPY